MPTFVTLRTLSTWERTALEELSASTTDDPTVIPTVVTRARLVLAVWQGEHTQTIADRFGISRRTVYRWLHRFNEAGIAGLEDKPIPQLYTPKSTPEQRRIVVDTARLDPQTLGLPYTWWSSDRLAQYLRDAKGLCLTPTYIQWILYSQGMRIRRTQSWAGEGADPAFVARWTPHNHPAHRS